MVSRNTQETLAKLFIVVAVIFCVYITFFSGGGETDSQPTPEVENPDPPTDSETNPTETDEPETTPEPEPEPESVELTIELMNKTGDPLNGEVSVNDTTKTIEGSKTFEVSTNTDVTVSASSEGYQNTEETVSINTSNKTTTVVLEQSSEPDPTPERVNLEVRLENPDGDLVKGKVNITGMSKTNHEASMFRFEVKSNRDIDVSAFADGYQDANKTVNVGTTDTSTTVVLEPEKGQLSVNLVNNKTNEQINSANITLTGDNVNKPITVGETTNLNVGEYTLTVNKDGFEQTTKTITIQSNQTTNTTIKLTPTE